MNNRKQTGLVQGLKLGFSIFMVLFYLMVAVLLVLNFFGLPRYLSWFFAVVFAAYGIYRGYREYKGEHTYGMRRDDDDEEQYMTYNERLKRMEENNNENKI
jgi:sensor histidine kinase YesM